MYFMCNCRGRAHLALKEGLKANYESWHMWENFLVVSLVFFGTFNNLNETRSVRITVATVLYETMSQYRVLV